MADLSRWKVFFAVAINTPCNFLTDSFLLGRILCRVDPELPAFKRLVARLRDNSAAAVFFTKDDEGCLVPLGEKSSHQEAYTKVLSEQRPLRLQLPVSFTIWDRISPTCIYLSLGDGFPSPISGFPRVLLADNRSCKRTALVFCPLSRGTD